METQPKIAQPKQFIVVFRASSAPIIPFGHNFRINVPASLGTIMLTFQTRYVDKGLEHPLPGDMWIDARGPAGSIEEAVSTFGNAAGSIIPVMTLSTNAAINDLEPELAYESTPGIEIKSYLQSMLPDEMPIIHRGRILHTDATIALLKAIEGHNERSRIIRSIGQYRLALNHWRWGHETLATAHLYIGMETLTKAVVRGQQQSSGLVESDFARQLGVDPASLGPCDRLSSMIEAATRRNLLFQGDEDCHKGAKAASDGFEHGYMPFDQIRQHAQGVRDKTATYLREAIIGLLDLEQAYREIILSSPQNEPLGRWPIVKYMRGQLLGASADLALEGNEYPLLRWRSSIKSVQINDKGEYQVELVETMTPQLGEGILFQAETFEVWGP